MDEPIKLEIFTDYVLAFRLVPLGTSAHRVPCLFCGWNPLSSPLMPSDAIGFGSKAGSKYSRHPRPSHMSARELAAANGVALSSG